jgi:hypothetical protein
MDALENAALVAALGQIAHQLQHVSDNSKHPNTKSILAPIITAIRGALVSVASM